ncbi:MAG: ABC transporter substrate-binding protein [Bacteroidales bacterium]|nr:ABC transporter substrate-binding protein [Bacteroidales bacterium]MCI2122015.1 ABC transporter substrate-binding protein [Bacteroidales bacterium]MCI2145181.1 ABC transporter substrate-binding protein [Bacteroidales bacterium]
MKKILVALAVLLSLVSCSSHSLTVALDQAPSAQYAGIYCALANGYYKKAGLDVQVKYVETAKGYQTLQSGEADIINEPLLNAVEFKAKSGMDMVNFLQTSQVSGLTVVTHDKISEFKQLDGKLIGYKEDGYDLMVRAMFAMKGMSVEWVKVKDYHDFVDDKVDAYVSMDYGDLFDIAGAGGKPFYIFSLSRMGFDVPEDGYYTMRKLYEGNSGIYKKFAEATVKGWKWADTSRVQAVNVVTNEIVKQGLTPDEKHENWILTEVLKYQVDPVARVRTFKLFEETEDAANAILIGAKLIESPISVMIKRTTPVGSTFKEANPKDVDAILNNMYESGGGDSTADKK